MAYTTSSDLGELDGGRRVHHIADHDETRDGYALCGAELPRDLLGPGHSCDECLRINRERRAARR